MLKQKPDKRFLLTPAFRVDPVMVPHTGMGYLNRPPILPLLLCLPFFHQQHCSSDSRDRKPDFLSSIFLLNVQTLGFGGWGWASLFGFWGDWVGLGFLKKGHSGFVWHKSKKLKGFCCFLTSREALSRYHTSKVLPVSS